MYNANCELFVAGSGKTLDGTEMMRYVEPFSANADDPKHPMLVLVYRQRGRVQMEEYQRGCSPSVVNNRLDSRHFYLFYRVDQKKG